MKVKLRNNSDFWAGVMLLGIGAVAMFISRDYQFSSALRSPQGFMGPGFFPTILGGILIAFGICIIVVGLKRGEKIQGSLSFRALVMLPLSLVLFGILMAVAGFVPALVALVFLSAASGKEFRFGEVLVMTALLTGGAAALFIWGLGLPYPLIKGF